MKLLPNLRSKTILWIQHRFCRLFQSQCLRCYRFCSPADMDRTFCGRSFLAHPMIPCKLNDHKCVRCHRNIWFWCDPLWSTIDRMWSLSLLCLEPLWIRCQWNQNCPPEFYSEKKINLIKMMPNINDEFKTRSISNRIFPFFSFFFAHLKQIKNRAISLVFPIEHHISGTFPIFKIITTRYIIPQITCYPWCSHTMKPIKCLVLQYRVNITVFGCAKCFVKSTRKEIFRISLCCNDFWLWCNFQWLAEKEWGTVRNNEIGRQRVINVFGMNFMTMW